MGAIKPDFSEAKEFGQVPPDAYQMVVEGAEEFVAKTGTRSLAVHLEILDNKNGVHGRKMTRNFPIEGPGTGFLADFLKAVGIKKEAFTDTNQLMGKRLTGHVQVRMFENEERSDVRRFSPAKS